VRKVAKNCIFFKFLFLVQLFVALYIHLKASEFYIYNGRMTRQSVGSLQIERTAGTLRGIQVKCTRADKILLQGTLISQVL
jgi:hypothetical protein